MTRRGLRAAALVAGTMLASAAAGAEASHYLWRNAVVGGGGYIPNVIFSPVARGLAYARSDMGGAYRWDAAEARWTPLQDGFAESWAFGVESLAPDPVDSNVVYAAVGMYHGEPAAILRSSDRGAHWTAYAAPFHMGGNEDGRGVGERLAIDPSAPRILYFGSRFDGLQRSTDSGAHWTRVASLPSQPLPPPPGWGATRAGVSFVVFAPTGEARGAATRTLFAGVADPGAQHLFRSDDAGANWIPVAGGPDARLLPLRAEFDHAHTLYLTYADVMGPNGAARGGVWKLDTRTNAWTEISPVRGEANRSGYIGLALDPQRPGVVMVASMDRWTPGDAIWRSTDAGLTWRDLVPLSRRDVSATPFLRWGQAQARFGWWISALAIDPFDSDFAVYGTGATLYADTRLTDADRARPLTWRPWVAGIEQTAVIALASPSAGAPLLSGFGDISGFVHRRLDVSPIEQFVHPVFSDTDTVSVAAAAPQVVVRSGRPGGESGAAERAARFAWSGDGGAHWTPLFPPAGSDGAPIVVSADGASFVVAATTATVSRDRGASWNGVKGLPTRLRPVADAVDPLSFYALDTATGRLFASRDGGRSFALRSNLGLTSGTGGPVGVPLVAGIARGELWWLSSGGLRHSTDGGASFERLPSGPVIRMLSLGAPLAAGAPAALYAVASDAGFTAVWRSADAGRRWIRLNDDAHRWGQRLRAIAADPRRAGRVYLATDGRGVLYGDDLDLAKAP